MLGQVSICFGVARGWCAYIRFRAARTASEWQEEPLEVFQPEDELVE